MRQGSGMARSAACAMAIIVAAGCSSAPTDADAVFSLDVEPLPYPAVVAGDTLRDANGLPAPLRATAYDAGGDPILDAPIEFFTSNANVTVENGILVANGEAGSSVRVFARVAGLTMELAGRTPLQIVRRPALLEGSGELPDSVSYEDIIIRSEPIATLLSSEPASEGGNGQPVSNWLVHYAIEYRGAVLGPDDPRFRLVQPGGTGEIPAPVDTTDAGGVTAREVVVLDASEIASGESLVVLVRAAVRGEDVVGSPLSVPLRLAAPAP